MENVNILADLLQAPGPDSLDYMYKEVQGFMTEGSYIDYIPVMLTKWGIVAIMGRALKAGYRSFAVYVYVSDDNDVVVKVFEMDSQHIWLNTEKIES